MDGDEPISALSQFHHESHLHLLLPYQRTVAFLVETLQEHFQDVRRRNELIKYVSWNLTQAYVVVHRNLI
jgi:hypothetical protein